jgi:hypothetical protein
LIATGIEPSETAKWDPHLVERVMGLIRPIVKGYHRAEVRGLQSFPSGGALVVANHSGGLFAMDAPVFATGFYETFGYGRPVYTLSHDILLTGPVPVSVSILPERKSCLRIRSGLLRPHPRSQPGELGLCPRSCRNGNRPGSPTSSNVGYTRYMRPLRWLFAHVT